MSTKIYDAWRFPSERLNEYLDWSRKQVLKTVKKRVIELMEALQPKIIEGFGEPLEHFKNGRDVWERHKRMDYIMKCCREAANSKQRDVIFDIECGINLWLHNGMFYAVAVTENWIADSLRKPPDWVEEYHYQNSTDKPDEVSNEEWDERRDNWEAVCAGYPSNHNNRRLFFEIVAAKSEMDTFDLEFDIAGRDLQIFLDGRADD